MQDSFLLAYKGLISYSEPLRIINSLVKINTKQFVHWRTFQWHWDTLASLIDYLPDTSAKFQVKTNFKFLLFSNPFKATLPKTHLSPPANELKYFI
jgi:hypothetical protein